MLRLENINFFNMYGISGFLEEKLKLLIVFWNNIVKQ